MTIASGDIRIFEAVPGTRLIIGKLGGRSRPQIALWHEGQGVALASFNSDDQAEAFVQVLETFLDQIDKAIEANTPKQPLQQSPTHDIPRPQPDDVTDRHDKRRSGERPGDE